MVPRLQTPKPASQRRKSAAPWLRPRTRRSQASQLMHEAKPAQVPAAWVFTLPWLVGACKPDIEKTEEFVTDPAALNHARK